VKVHFCQQSYAHSLVLPTLEKSSLFLIQTLGVDSMDVLKEDPRDSWILLPGVITKEVAKGTRVKKFI
jgi:hypothetical protein